MSEIKYAWVTGKSYKIQLSAPVQSSGVVCGKLWYYDDTVIILEDWECRAVDGDRNEKLTIPISAITFALGLSGSE